MLRYKRTLIASISNMKEITTIRPNPEPADPKAAQPVKYAVNKFRYRSILSTRNP